MRPTNRSQSNFKPNDGKQNGTCTYQLILNSMQVLPVADISKIALIGNGIVDSSSPSKGKRKARAETGAQPEKKK
jgi:hypothetical protein